MTPFAATSTRAIYEGQPAERSWAASAIHIIVKNGYVTLEGVVKSEADRTTAHLQALQIRDGAN